LISTEHPFDTDSAQYRWFSNHLANEVDRAATPWLIVAGHRPMYIDSTNWDQPAGDQVVAVELRNAFEPLLLQHQVDLCFWGHHHSYQRSCPVFNQSCVATAPGTYSAPVHLVLGMAGAGLSQNIQDTPPDWAVVVNDQQYGYSSWHVTPTKISMRAFNDKDGTLLDHFTIDKQQRRNP